MNAIVRGVVASMTVGDATKSIGLRADTDALPIQEDNNLPYKSEVAGVSHLCGHDGHAAIAREAFGDNAVMDPGPSYLGSEDFAFMLQRKKGTYCLLDSWDTAMVHHPQYVFDNAILPIWAAYWVTLTERYLQ